MQRTEKFKKLLDDDPVLNRICLSKYFMMRQTSDIIAENIFDHVSFVGSEPIDTLLSKEYGLESEKNTVMVDSYVQLFVSEEVFNDNKETFGGERNGVNYSVVEHYDEVFKGFIMCKDYFILLNGDNFDHRYGVYILIDNSSGDKFICNNSNRPITFFGFINIGYLIDPLGYTEEQMLTFESNVGFTIPPLIRGRLEQTSLINYKSENKIFHVDLINYNESVKEKYIHPGKSITNSKYIKNIVSSDNSEESIQENLTFTKSMTNGFLYIGLLNKITVEMEVEDDIVKRTDEIYLLMNYIERPTLDFSFTIWQYTVLNNNAGKVLDLYTEENSNKTLDELNAMEKQYNMFDVSQIMHSMKYLTNI